MILERGNMAKRLDETRELWAKASGPKARLREKAAVQVF
jgi:hypothetical protein